MARLIPSFVDDLTPPGERMVFEMLAAGPDEWTAIHSLDLAPWNRGLRTEIDFVVTVPDAGILCVEVKSHDSIDFEDGRWYPHTITRSPFKQAIAGRYAFYHKLREIAPRFASVPVVHCCVFPRAVFPLRPNLSVQPWELMDARAFGALGTGDAFCADIKARIEQSIAADGQLSPMANPLSLAQIDEIVGCCLPIRKRRPEARVEIDRREEEIGRILRVQQKPVLELAALNDRLVVSGGAGTGKTLIAMEVARRAAERGRRVALLCFNRLVGDWIKEHIAKPTPAPPHLIVGRAIHVMADLASIQIPADPPRNFWEHVLPLHLEERLTDPDLRTAASFDYLVVDEAQDVLARPRLWECMTQFLDGGVEKGSYALFGDFDNQVLGARGPMDLALARLEAITKPARWRLAENCRNYKIVGDAAVSLSGLREPVYSGYMRVGGGLRNYDIFFYRDADGQLDQAAHWLRDFKAQGYKPSEITILSFCSPENGVVAQLMNANFRLRPAWRNGEQTSYASVHSFKGMENKVVILTDIVLGEPEFHRNLFYTGMTRATESVRVLCDYNSKDMLLEWISGKGDP